MITMIPESDIQRLEAMGYRFIGKHKHSAIKTCTWTRKAMTGEGTCYKQKFYGIKTHRCLQMSPAVQFCKHRCRFCWRDTSITTPEWKGPADGPDEIIEGCLEAHRELLTGFGGNEKADPLLLKEALKPNQVAISLAGEPTEYPKISQMIEAFKERGFTVFLVTNGTNPQVIENMAEPTNLYVTLPAPDKEVYEKTCSPLIDSWEKIMESLNLLKNFSCKTVVRLTLVRGLNMVNPEGYARIVEKYEPDFLEVKSFMSVGFSRERLPYGVMPLHPEIMEFARKIEENCGYRIADESKPSRIALMKK